MNELLIAIWLEGIWESGGYVDHTDRKDMLRCGWCAAEYALD